MRIFFLSLTLLLAADAGIAQSPTPSSVVDETPSSTPLMEYRKQVVDIIYAHWRELAGPQVKELPHGETLVHIHISANGKVKEVTVIQSDSQKLTGLARQAIMESKLPPVPENVKPAMKNGVLEVIGSFSVYPPTEHPED